MNSGKTLQVFAMHLCGEGDLMMVHHGMPTWKAEVQNHECWESSEVTLVDESGTPSKCHEVPACGINIFINRC